MDIGLNTFFITGLPRSRTAWLSNLLTYRNSFCYHELARHGGNARDLIKKMETRTERFVGTADSSFPIYHKSILELVPESKIVVIDRNINDVKNSLCEFLGGWSDELDETVEKTGKALYELTRHYDCKIIGFNDLEDTLTVKSIVDYISPNDWDVDRFTQLDRMNVGLNSKWLVDIDLDDFNSLLGVG